MSQADYFFRKLLIKIKRTISFKTTRGWLYSGIKSVAVGKGCVILNVQFSPGCTVNDYTRLIGSPQIKIGKDVYINCFTMISGEIRIGDNALISQYVNIWGRAHRFCRKDLLIWDQHGVHGRDDQGYDVKPVNIGKGVWIGPFVTVFRGVTIGEGAVIGANSVVTKDIPPYAVAWGVPATVQKYRV